MIDNIDRYKEPRKKTIDFIIGFFLNIVIGAGHFSLYFLLYGVANSFSGNGMSMVVTVLLIALITSVEWFTIRHFFKNRKYIAIGMLASLLLPLLVTGFCSVMFNQSYLG